MMTGSVGLRVDCDGNHVSEAREEVSRDKLRYVRPGDAMRALKRALYDSTDSSDMMLSDVEENQGELFPVDADDEAYDWDEEEDDGIAPPGGQRC